MKRVDTFRELWHTKFGETYKPFTVKVIVRYDVEVIEGRTKFTRTLINPARPNPVTEKIVQAIDTEAAESLENIKRNVENAA